MELKLVYQIFSFNDAAWYKTLTTNEIEKTNNFYTGEVMKKRLLVFGLLAAILLTATSCSLAETADGEKIDLVTAIKATGNQIFSTYTTADGREASTLMKTASRCAGRDILWEKASNKDWYAYVPSFTDRVDIVLDGAFTQNFYWHVDLKDTKAFTDSFMEAYSESFDEGRIEVNYERGTSSINYEYQYESKDMTFRVDEMKSPEEMYPSEEDAYFGELVGEARKRWGTSNISVKLTTEKVKGEEHFNAHMVIEYSWDYDKDITLRHGGDE